MARQQPNSRLAALLTEANWSAGELARAVNGMGQAHGLTLRYDRTSVAHWLVGSRPREPVTALVAHALSDATGRLVTTEDTGLARPSSLAQLALAARPDQVDPVTWMVTLTRGDADPASRAHLTHADYELAAVTPAAWPRRRPVPPSAARSRATESDVHRLHSMAGFFADLAERHGGAHARSALATYLADDAGRLLTARASTELHCQLLTATAQLTHLLAAMTADAGHPGLAQRYYRSALGLAHKGGCRRTYAITLRALSAQATRLGHHRHSLELAEAAVAAAGPDTTCATMAFLLSQRAVAHARARQPQAALRDLVAAQTQHERAAGLPGPFTAYPRAGLDYQRAQAQLVLGNRADALSALRDSAAHRPPEQRRSFALTQAGLAEVLLEVGHLEEACTHWHHFLDQCPHLNSVQISRALTRLRAGLRPHRLQRHAAVVWERSRLLADPQVGS